MKKKIISILLASTLLTGCGSTKNLEPCCVEETSVEKIVTKDPLMKLLVSALVIYSLQILLTR